ARWLSRLCFSIASASPGGVWASCCPAAISTFPPCFPEKAKHMIHSHQRASDRSMALIESYYAAFNRGDWEAMLGLLAPDVAHDLNQGAREIGIDAFRVFLARMQKSYAEQLRDIRILASVDGRHAAAEYVVHGQYLADDDGLPPA